jgi:hypothetical protein
MATNSYSKNSAKLVKPTLSTGCIFLSKPFPECYCTNMTSFKIFKMLAYCSGNFKMCTIYCNKVEMNNKLQAI